MTQWHVKEFSRLTGVTVQTLHHYDHIGLLKPSLRTSNGYRVYTSGDLLALQHITALKFFGFKLKQIQNLLSGGICAWEHFALQAQLLDQKAQSMLAASQTLKDILSQHQGRQNIPWETIIETIEVYHMTQNMEKYWVKEILSPQEMNQYAKFLVDLKHRSKPWDKAEHEKNWAQLMEKIRQNLHQDPQSDFGIQMATQCMSLINQLYGTNYAHLRTKIFEQGFGEGKGLDEANMTPEMLPWLEKALYAYWRQRAYDIFNQLEIAPQETLVNLWQDLLQEMYGDDREKYIRMLDAVEANTELSEPIKQWVRQTHQLIVGQ